MTDIIPHVAELLAPTGAQIELSWQDTCVTFPLIVLSVPGNTATTSDGAEVLSRISVQADVFTIDKKAAADLAKEIDSIMTAGGFTRSTAIPMKDGELERFMLQYSCTVDYTHQRILL